MSKNKGGRPSKYTQELADKICSLLAQGISLRTVCDDESMPDKSTVFRWLRENEEFQDQYARAKEESADALFEETIDIADASLDSALNVANNPKLAGALVQAQRLRVDTRKWMMSKMKPKKYGEKVDVTSGGKPIPILGNVRQNISNSENSETEEEN